MDLNELTIKVSVAADEAMQSLDALTQKVQSIGQTAAKRLNVQVDTSSVKQGTQALEGMAQTANRAAQALKDINGNPINLDALKADLAAQAEANATAFEADIARRKQEIAARAQATAQEASTAAQQAVEAVAAAADGSEQAVQQVAQQTRVALGETGTAGVAAGTQVAAGAATGTAGLVAMGTAGKLAGIEVNVGALFAGNGLMSVAYKALAANDAIMGLAKSAKSLFYAFMAANVSMTLKKIVETVRDMVTAQEKQQQLLEEEARKSREIGREYARQQQEKLSGLDELISRHQKLSGKTTLTASENEEILSIQQEICSQYDIIGAAIDNVTAKTNNWADAIMKVKEAQAAAAASAQFDSLAADTVEWQRNAKIAMDSVASVSSGNATLQTMNARQQGLADGTIKTMAEIEAEYDTFYERFLGFFKNKAEEAGLEINETMLSMFSSIDPDNFNLEDYMSTEEAVEAVYLFADAVVGACSSEEARSAISAINAYKTSLLGNGPDDATKEAAEEAYSTLTGIFTGLLANYKELGTDENNLYAAADILVQGLTGLGGAFDEVTQTVAGAKAATTGYNQTLSECRTAIDNLRTMDSAVKRCKNLSKEYRELKASGQDTKTIWASMVGAAKQLGYSFDESAENVLSFDEAIGQSEKAVSNASSSIVDRLNAVITESQAAYDALWIDGQITVDEEDAIKSINNVMSAAKALLWVLSFLGLVNGDGETPPPKSGGGGGKKNDAEEAARKAEQARKDAIQADYDYIDHRRHMNEATLEEYIAFLEQMTSRHRMTAEEIMDLEERIFDARQELWDERAEKVDTLAEGVVTALENRYQAMLDAETEKLDASRKAWQDWADESTAAIQAQIDALDALSQTEDREAKDAEELRKIAKLQQEIQFEQDEYNRGKLQQQLEAAIQSRAERLRKLDIADQKAALQKQMEAVQAEADKQSALLDEQQTEIEKAYEARMKQSALEAEAQKLLMSSTQAELLDLIGTYADEYNATGKSLGEKLADGFMAAVGNIESWFASFNEKIEAMQYAVAQEATAAADAFYSGRDSTVAAAKTVTIEQNNTYNVPVESPSDTARKVAQANEDLGLALLGL